MILDGAHDWIRPHVMYMRLMGATVANGSRLSPASLAEIFESLKIGEWPNHRGDEAGYDRVSYLCAKVVRQAYDADERLTSLGPHGDESGERRVNGIPISHAVLLWDLLTAGDHAWLAEGLSTPTAFQWGWGVNCARRLAELDPVANPALAFMEDGLPIIAGRMADV